MSRSGYDAVVDVDDEVSPRPKAVSLSAFLSIHRKLTPPSSFFPSRQAGRPRPHRPTRRPRVSHVQFLGDITCPRRRRRQRPQQQQVGLAPPAARDGRVVVVWRRRGGRGGQQAVPVDAVVLRAVLRRGHDVGPAAVLGGALPARQLPRRARGQPGPLRPLLDRHHCRPHPLPRRHHQRLPGPVRAGHVRL